MFNRCAVLAIILALGMAIGAVLVSHSGTAGLAPAGPIAGSASSSPAAPLASSKSPIAIPPIPVHRLGYSGPDTVDPTSHYTAEPAPMGIADFGVGAGGQAYTYSTSEFLGNFSWTSLNIQESGDTSFTDQLNVVLQFVQQGVTYAYWIQDVAFMNSATNQLTYENNIWNFSSTSACLDNTGVSGNGTVYAYSGCIGYYAVAATSQPGADLTMPNPGDFGLLVRSYENAHGVPEVAFEYWDGVTSWYVTYDNVVWPWATSVSSDNNFVVDGSGYNPYGLYYDAELTIGGPGGGAATSAENPTHITSRLLYWNGHNFEAPPSVWNFGSNTAEAVSNVQSIFSSDSAGLPLTLQLNGTARNDTPAQSYDQDQVGELAISASGLSAGTVAIPGDTWNFVNGSATLTLVPGTYPVWVNSSASDNDLGSCQITAGATLDVTLGDTCSSGTSNPSVSTPTASASGADVGQSVTFQSTLLSAGSGGDTYVWHTSPTGLGCATSTSLSLSCTPTATGTYHINITVTDSDSQSATSGTVTFTVDSDPTVATPSASKSTVETGETVSFSASPTGGATPYAYHWSGLPTPCTQTTSASPSCTPGSAGTYSISVLVSDANGYSVTSPSLSYTVLSGPSVSVPSANPTSAIDLGQSVTFSTTATGGTGTYTYSWSGLPTGCSSSASPELSCTPSAAGDFLVTVSVEDTDGGAATSGALSFTVDTDPAIGALTASPATVDLGEPLDFNVTGVTGGDGSYNYSWSGLPTGCLASDTPILVCQPSAVGSGTVTVTLTDGNGLSASSSVSFQVFIDPSVSGVSLSRESADQGQSVTFSATGVTGGTGSYRYLWTGLPAGCSSANASSVVCVPTAPGASQVTVRVTDSSGFSVEGFVEFTVCPDPTVGTPTGPSTPVPVGQVVVFSVNATGGSGPLTYLWSGLPPGCLPSNASSIECVPSAAGTTAVTVSVTDSNGVSARSGALDITVSSSAAPPFSVSGEVTGGNLLLGGFIALAAILVGLVAWESLRGRRSP